MKGNARYISDDWDLWYSFKIEKSGYYKIYVENYGEKVVNVAGTCSLKEEEAANEKNNQYDDGSYLYMWNSL